MVGYRYRTEPGKGAADPTGRDTAMNPQEENSRGSQAPSG
jgi:hypothetical protein